MNPTHSRPGRASRDHRLAPAPRTSPLSVASATRLECELRARAGDKADAWAEIARACASDLGLELAVRLRLQRGPAGFEPTLTLHLPVELAASQHPAWCLACRIACFCPNLRVSVLVRSETAFTAAVEARRIPA